MTKIPPHDNPYRTGQTGKNGYVVCGARGKQRKHAGAGCSCGFSSELIAEGDPCPCGERPMPNGRCKLHGGKTPKGWALPQTKTGRYSRDLPTRLAASFGEMVEASRGEHTVLELEIALLRVRLSELLGRVDGGDSGRLWVSLKAAWDDLERGRRAGDTEAVAESLTEIGSLIGHGYGDHAIWQDVGATIERIRRLSETEQRRIASAQRSITEAQALAMMGVFTSAVREVVHDPAQLEAIRARFAAGMTFMGVSIEDIQ